VNWGFFATTVIIYVVTSLIAAWGLDLQFGSTGVLNFSFIIFVAAGAYTAAILTLGSPSGPGNVAQQQYFAGATLPFPLPWIGAMVVGGILGLLVGLVALKRLRGDYEAIVMLVVSLMALYIVLSDVGFLNGASGLALIPSPLQSGGNLTGGTGYGWFYSGLTVVVGVIVGFVMHRLMESPLGRALRAVRENERAAEAMGRNTAALRLLVFALGGSLGALSGAILVGFINAWSPGAWGFAETFLLFAAVIVGGQGNLVGVAVGAFIIFGLIIQGVLFLPQIGGDSALTECLQWITAGLLILLSMWLRPQGIIPERRRRLSRWIAPARRKRNGSGLLRWR